MSEEQLRESENLYKNAQADMEVTKNTFISNLQQSVYTLQQDLQTLEKNKKSLEVSLKGAEDLGKFQKLSEEKLKSDALVTVTKEIETLKETMSSVETQLKELEATIENSDIKTACEGTVTFLDELNEGDIIQSGSRLCNIIPSSGQLKATIYIPENDISKVKIGSKTEYIFDGRYLSLILSNRLLINKKSDFMASCHVTRFFIIPIFI